MKLSLVTAALFLTATNALAATPDQLNDLRERTLPGQCLDQAKVQTHQISRGTLYQMACRNLATESLDIFILEDATGLKILRFPDLQLQPGRSATGTDDWAASLHLGIETTAPIPAPVVSPIANILRSTHRIAPGTGTGHLTSTYRLEQGGPVLESVIHASDDGTTTSIWPKPEVQDSARRVPRHLDGYNIEDASRYQGGSLFDILAQLETSFPEHVEEGKPNLEINASQYGNTLAVETRETGWLDDSVRGRATRVLLTRDGSGWIVAQVGTAWICARGTTRISAGPCP